MRRQNHDGHNELMIVNPGNLSDEETPNLGQLFFGDDGYVYQLQGLEQEEISQGLNEFYLGDDGTLYSLESHEPLGKYETEMHRPFSGYLLGGDGTLYEVI